MFENRKTRQSVIDTILEVGISRAPEGINNWALSSAQILPVLTKLKKANLPILGGDVLIKSNDGTAGFYHEEAWAVDRNDSEAFDAYVSRSHAHARKIIEHFIERDVYFSLVVEDSPLP